MNNIVNKIKKNRLCYIIIIAVILLIGYFVLGFMNSIVRNSKKERNIEIKKDKELIYSLFDNFPESKNIYYTFESLYSQRDIGPTIYQIDILAELTEESYHNFLNQVESFQIENVEMKFNPNNRTYHWKKIKILKY